MVSDGRTDRSNVDASGSGEVGRAAGRYLLALLRLSEREARRVPMQELRRRLDVSPASVTEMVEKLDDRALVDHEKYRGATLTPRGTAVAAELAWQFCAVSTFFESVLDAPLDDETAYRISFALPAEGVRELRRLSGRLCIDDCPIGARTPDECRVGA